MKPFKVMWLLPVLVVAQSTATAAPPAWQTGVETEDGTCGIEAGFVCTPTWGACCSKDNLCGRSSAFCGTGCQPNFGNCNAAPPPPPGPGSPSPDGSCGDTNQYKCTGTAFGDCCSSSGFCGATSGHCGAGCQPLFGTCPSGADNITTNGQCGTNGKTCTGSSFGDCCSSSAFCGSTADHCGSGCQPTFGTCSGAGAGNATTDGKCGANGKICRGSTFGDCCSSSGFCGSTADHCGAGCQLTFGTCSGTGTGNVTTDGRCGENGKICKGSAFGDCCSLSGFCGNTTDFCGPGCQTEFGNCTGTGNISTNGACGKNGKVCKGSPFGDCCSSSGFCGNTTDFCGAGCQTGFGTCTGSNISIDGVCGKNGKICKGSTFGDCCSSSGFCGKTTDFCGAGCQPTFGTCSTTSNISTAGACGKNGKTCQGSTFGDCCSSSGFCGKTTDFCGAGCQSPFGTCSSGSGTISTDGACGTKNSKTCVGSTFGNCCSSSGFCGNTANFCGQGCQKSASSACLTTNIPSVDGTCGASKGGFTCAGGDFNNQCCSAGGFCGTTTAFCGTGW